MVAVTDAKTHEERLRAARIMELKNTKAWDDLTEMLEGQAERFWTAQITQAKTGQAIDQRQIDYARGKLDGIRTILRAPEKAASMMERLTEQEEEAS
jgi:hypothetical protein